MFTVDVKQQNKNNQSQTYFHGSKGVRATEVLMCQSLGLVILGMLLEQIVDDGRRTLSLWLWRANQSLSLSPVKYFILHKFTSLKILACIIPEISLTRCTLKEIRGRKEQ